MQYGVATIGRLLKIIGLFCKRALQKRLYSAKETYNCKEPTNCSHPMPYSAAVCCNALQCVAVSVLQCVAVCCSPHSVLQRVVVCCSVLL